MRAFTTLHRYTIICATVNRRYTAVSSSSIASNARVALVRVVTKTQTLFKWNATLLCVSGWVCVPLCVHRYKINFNTSSFYYSDGGKHLLQHRRAQSLAYTYLLGYVVGKLCAASAATVLVCGCDYVSSVVLQEDDDHHRIRLLQCSCRLQPTLFARIIIVITIILLLLCSVLWVCGCVSPPLMHNK